MEVTSTEEPMEVDILSQNSSKTLQSVTISSDNETNIESCSQTTKTDSDDCIINSQENFTMSIDDENIFDDKNLDDVENISGKIKTKRQTIIDSDSDDENMTINVAESTDTNENVVKNNFQNKQKSHLIITGDENSENDNIFSNNKSDFASNVSQENKSNINSKKSRIISYDSDSSDEIVIKSTKSSENNSQGELIYNSEQDISKSRLSRLCDSESSSEENETNENVLAFDDDDEEIIVKHKKPKEKIEKPKKMTGKEAAEQRKQIVSENQRMLRETIVSLPYHRSKSHTLEEFMKKRAEIPDIVKSTKSIPNYMNLKMSSKQLELAAKQLEKREKVLDEFYKSDDEDEDVKENNEKDEQNEIDHKNNITDSDKEVKKSLEKNFANQKILEIDEDIDLITTVKKKLFEDEMKDKEQEKNNEENTQLLEENDTNLITLSQSSDSQNNETPRNKDLTVEDILKLTEERLKDDNLEDADFEFEIPRTDIHRENSNENNLYIQVDTENKLEKKENIPQQLPKTNKILEKLKKLNTTLAIKNNFRPKISGNSSDVIILDDDVEKSRAINDLKKRFIAHNSMKPVHTKDEYHIKSLDTNILKHEAAKVLIDHDDDHRVVELKPGEKFKKLRKELEQQMAKKRLEQWEKTQQEILKRKQEDEEMDDGDKDSCEIIFDDEDEEQEMSDSTTSDSDEEEMDIEIKDKPRVRSAFVDDEAEESETEDDEREDDNEDNQEDSEKEESTSEMDEEFQNTQEKKQLRRIISLSDDSDDETQLDETIKESIKKILSANNDNLPSTDDEADIPLYQMENLHKTPRRLPDNKSHLNVTPSLYLSTLKGKYDSKNLISPTISLSLPSKSPLKNNPGLKTKLFSSENENLSEKFGKFDSEQKMSTVSQEDELLGLISGNFDDIKETLKDVKSTQMSFCDLSEFSAKNKKENKNILVGKDVDTAPMSFVDLSQISENEKEKENTDLTEDSEKDHVIFDFNDDSDDLKITVVEDSLENKPDKFKETNIHDDLDDVKLILDDDSLENKFEKKESEAKSEKKKVQKSGKLVIVSSDDEAETILSLKKKKKKTKTRKLGFSDDELSDDDSDIEEIEEYSISADTEDINYDSEENEIEYDENEEIITTKKMAKTFFENEAELSESEWGSADEDEKDLDDMDREEGDEEQFNDRKLQKELGKIHMRQVMDQDTREVRILQELLLEDGELQGVGRERKFKWKNADSLSWNDSEQPKEEDDDTEEIENEIQWRKMRHEREIYLEEQRKKTASSDDVELLSNDSQIMKLGQEALKKSVDLSQVKNVTHIESSSVLIKKNFRGSFLHRSETTLCRLAEMTKVTNKDVLSGPKNSKNFVFTSVTKTEDTGNEGKMENDKKRKAADGTPKVLKKMRVSENSPAAMKSKKSLKGSFAQN